MPVRRISSLSMGVDEVTGAADAVFPVQASLFSSQRYGETAKDLLPFPACEILPKILIFEVCRLLIDEKGFGMQHQSESTFLDWTVMESIKQTSHTLACCWFVA